MEKLNDLFYCTHYLYMSSKVLCLALQWVTARDRFHKAACLMDAEQRMKKSMWGQFWSAHQRFFKYLCISAKVNHCVRIAREAVKNGKVCGLEWGWR